MDDYRVVEFRELEKQLISLGLDIRLTRADMKRLLEAVQEFAESDAFECTRHIATLNEIAIRSKIRLLGRSLTLIGNMNLGFIMPDGKVLVLESQ